VRARIDAQVQKPWPPRPPSEALANISKAGLRTLQAQPYLPYFPAITSASVFFGVRTCIPLRGSSGVSPDSLFHLRPKPENRGVVPLYRAMQINTTRCCGYQEIMPLGGASVELRPLRAKECQTQHAYNLLRADILSPIEFFGRFNVSLVEQECVAGWKERGRDEGCISAR